MYLNSVPDSTVSTEYTLRFSYPRRIEDFDNAGDDPDFIQEQLEMLVTNLAVRIRPKYPAIKINDILDVIGRAQILYDDLEVWTGEPEENPIFEPERID